MAANAGPSPVSTSSDGACLRPFVAMGVMTAGVPTDHASRTLFLMPQPVCIGATANHARARKAWMLSTSAWTSIPGRIPKAATSGAGLLPTI